MMKKLAILALWFFLPILVTGSVSSEKEAGTFSDPRDGQTYKWVKIGNQIWMAENMRFKTESGSWCWENDEKNCETKGRLYSWEAAKRATPQGWHLPSDEEWKELEMALGLTKDQADQEGFRRDADDLLAGKVKRIDAWPDWNERKPIVITNESGFSAIPTGHYANDEYSHEGYAGWWTSTEDEDLAWLRVVGFFDNSIARWKNKKVFAFAVRFVKNEPDEVERESN